MDYVSLVLLVLGAFLWFLAGWKRIKTFALTKKLKHMLLGLLFTFFGVCSGIAAFLLVIEG